MEYLLVIRINSVRFYRSLCLATKFTIITK